MCTRCYSTPRLKRNIWLAFPLGSYRSSPMALVERRMVRRNSEEALALVWGRRATELLQALVLVVVPRSNPYSPGSTPASSPYSACQRSRPPASNSARSVLALLCHFHRTSTIALTSCYVLYSSMPRSMHQCLEEGDEESGLASLCRPGWCSLCAMLHSGAPSEPLRSAGVAPL